MECTFGCLAAHCTAHNVAASNRAIRIQASTLSVFLNTELWWCGCFIGFLRCPPDRLAPANVIDLSLDNVLFQRFQRQ